MSRNAWDLAHPEKMREYRRKWKRNNKEARMRWQRESRQRHPLKALMYRDVGKPHKNAQQREKRALIRRTLMRLMGGRCVSCGFDDPRALQVDHINGDGYLVKNTRHQLAYSYLKAIQADREAFLAKHQLLCANCNQIKKFERGEHLHSPNAKKHDVIPRPWHNEAEGEVGLA